MIMIDINTMLCFEKILINSVPEGFPFYILFLGENINILVHLKKNSRVEIFHKTLQLLVFRICFFTNTIETETFSLETEHKTKQDLKQKGG